MIVVVMSKKLPFLIIFTNIHLDLKVFPPPEGRRCAITFECKCKYTGLGR